MKRIQRIQYSIQSVTLAIFLLLSVNTKASETKEEKFKPGEMIVEHVIDNHEWHIATFGDIHVSVPLPIILLDEGQIVTFMSSDFEHGHASYKGYALGNEGSDKGKIIKVDAEGKKIESAEIYDFSITKNVLSLFFSVIILCFLFIYISKRYKRNPLSSPKGIQSLLEVIIVFVRDDIAKSSIGSKFERYLPILLTIFFFILINNLLGIIPIFPGGSQCIGEYNYLFSFGFIYFCNNNFHWK